MPRIGFPVKAWQTKQKQRTLCYHWHTQIQSPFEFFYETRPNGLPCPIRTLFVTCYIHMLV